MRGFFDLIIMPAVVVILAIVLLFCYFFAGALIEKAKATEPVTAVYPNIQGKYIMFDKLFIIVIAFLGTFIIGSAYYIDSNPLFLIVGIIGLLIALLIAPTFTNVYDTVIQKNQNITDSANAFPIMTKTIRNLPLIILLLGSASIIVTYGKLGGYI